MGIKPLISTKDILETKKEKKKFDNSIICDDLSHEFFLTKEYKEFSELLNELKENHSYHFVSFGNWSLKHIVFHVLTLTGKAAVYSTTYGLGPGSARGIVDAINKGIISEFHFLYDWKIQTYKQEAHHICAENFPVKITSIHAKITTIINDNFGVIINGSANWSDSNHKIESVSIIVNKQLAEFHKNWILKSIESKHTEPKEIYNEFIT